MDVAFVIGICAISQQGRAERIDLDLAEFQRSPRHTSLCAAAIVARPPDATLAALSERVAALEEQPLDLIRAFKA